MEYLVSLVNQNYTDAKIRDKLNEKFGVKWSLNTIRRNRRNKGINKNKSDYLHKNSDSLFSSSLPPGLDSQEQADWFRLQFRKTHLYDTLKQQLTTEEIEVYVEEYGSVCCQFRDIVTSEFFQIDDFLKHRILINRQLTMMKSIQEDINELADWFDNHSFADLETKDQKQVFMSKNATLSNLRKDLNLASDRYDKLVKERKVIAENLAATRRDRLDDLKGGKQDFFTLIKNLQMSELARDNSGKLAELCKIALNDADSKLHEYIKFDDGSQDPIILDSESVSNEDS